MVTEIAKYIDHTLLKPDATSDMIKKLCEEAIEHKFAAVCVNPCYVSLASEILRDSGVKVCTVVGFPLGATTTDTKSFEAREAVLNGADEIDMVINIGYLKSGDIEYVRKDIQSVVRAVKDISQEKIVKVILETAYLTDKEIKEICNLCKNVGVDFVKTSTGFGPKGATVEAVALMRETVGNSMGVKAAGGIRDYKTAIKMIKAGANRIGSSASLCIISDKTEK